ncbi:MAG: hypothetical protein JWP78_2314 [Mucilaginibacter sp.]|nr:hypothetical protein [Mucilaginibacter sp.]
MPVSDTCIYFIIAILGLAYPISLGVITRLDEKYKSIYITNLFRGNLASRAFQGLLIASLVAVLVQVLWIVNFKMPAVENLISYDWADITLIAITTLLIISFFFYTWQIFRFYIPLNLANLLREQQEDKEYTVFKAMADLQYTGIAIHDDKLLQTISRYYYQQFKSKRIIAGDEPVRYPYEYYDMVYKTIFRAAKSEFRIIQHTGATAASGIWLLGEMEYTNIDDLTYAWLWNNLKLMVILERDDYVLEFWKNSHQFFYTALAHVPLRTDWENDMSVLNQPEVDRREKERDRFFEFHTGLGGMLLYKKRYELLKSLFNHTTGIPVRYELLPVTMNTVFALFFRFWNADGMFYIGKYQLPDSDGIYGEFLSKEWICRYVALLLIRQYHLTSQWYGYEPVELPQIPATQEERDTWIQQLKYLKTFVAEIQQNESLLKALDYKPITAEWAATYHKPLPEALIDQTIAKSQAVYAAAQVEQRASDEKKASFFEKSSTIIAARINAYQNILNERPVTEDFNSSTVRGGYILYQKAAFANDQGITYLNYDTFFASEIAAKITRQVIGLFRNKTNASYVFRAAQLFQAIDRLQLIPRENVLLNSSIAIDVVNSTLKNTHLSPEQYQGIPIINIRYTDQNILRSSLIAIKKSDLPSFNYAAPDPQDIERFNLKPINADIGLYAGVIDLNEEEQFKALFPNEPAETLDASVLMDLDFRLEVRWKNKVKAVRLELYSDFYELGTVNDLGEVQPF